MEVISSEVIKKIGCCEAQDLSNTSWAYARLAIVHYTMLASISESAIKIIQSFTAQNLTNTAWSFATLAILNEPLLEATSAEVQKKSPEFCAQNFGNTLWAFAICGLPDRPLRDAISKQAIRKLQEYDLQALAWLADFELDCHDSVLSLLDREVEGIWRQLSGFEESGAGLDEAFMKFLRSLRVDNLGAVGDRLLLSRMGVREADAGLEERALQTIARHKLEDPREDPHETKFGGPTRHKRVFSYAEFRVRAACMGPEPVEGAWLQENGARGPHSDSSPLRPVPLPINERVERSACSEFLLLAGLCKAWQEAGAAGDRARGELTGTLRLYSTGPSCLSCVAALWQFGLCYPRVALEVSYSATQPTTLVALQRLG